MMNLKSGFSFLVIATVIMIFSGVATGADVGNNPSDTGACPQNCDCLTNESANWKYLLPLQCSEDICGYSPDGLPRYCYMEGRPLSPYPLTRQPCSSGCTCLAPEDVPWVEIFNADGTMTHEWMYEQCSDIPCAGEYENPKFCYRVPGAISYACDHTVTVYSGLKGYGNVPMDGVPITIYGAMEYGTGYDATNIIGAGITDSDGKLDVPIPTSALENWAYFYVNVGELPENYFYAGSRGLGKLDENLNGTVYDKDEICPSGESTFWLSNTSPCWHRMNAEIFVPSTTSDKVEGSSNDFGVSGVNMKIFGSNDTGSYNGGDIMDTCVTGASGTCYLFIPDSALDRWDYFFTFASVPPGYTPYGATAILIEKDEVSNGDSRFLFKNETAPTTATPATATPSPTSAALNIGIILSALSGTVLLFRSRRSP